MPWPKANVYHTSSPRVQMAFGVQWQQMILPDLQGSSFQAAVVPAAGAMDMANFLAAMAGAAAPARPAMPPTGVPAVTPEGEAAESEPVVRRPAAKAKAKAKTAAKRAAKAKAKAKSTANKVRKTGKTRKDSK